MLNAPVTSGGAGGAPGGGSQPPQLGSGGEQARPAAGEGEGQGPGVSYINVTAQEKESIDRVGVFLSINLLISLSANTLLLFLSTFFFLFFIILLSSPCFDFLPRLKLIYDKPLQMY